MIDRQQITLVFAGSMIFVTAIWLFNFPWYDISGDTAAYALLGRFLWETGRYTVDGTTPYALHLPWLAFISYPFTFLLGANLGMKLLSLLAGFGVMYVSYELLKRFFPQPIALAVVPLLALHHSFNYLVLGGGTDLHYAILFLAAVLFLHRGLTESPRWFLPMGIYMGLACLARYNGVFLFPLAAGVMLYQRRSLRLPVEFYTGMTIGVSLFSIWLLRNYFVFGSPLYSEYREQLSPNYVSVITENTLFYLNPLHNVLPVLFVCLLVGLWNHWRGRMFLLWTAASAVVLTMIWTTLSMRFVFPAFPILLAFAAWGAVDIVTWFPKQWRKTAVAMGVFLIVATHAGMLCLYTVSVCHVWFDQNIGLIPPVIPLTIEPRYSFAEAKMYLNETASAHAQILTKDILETISYERGLFRSDLQVSHVPGRGCPVYHIDFVERIADPIFVSKNQPKVAVGRSECLMLRPRSAE